MKKRKRKVKHLVLANKITILYRSKICKIIFYKKNTVKAVML